MIKPGAIKFIHFLLGAIVFLVPLVFSSQFVYRFIPTKTFLFYALVEIAFFIWIYLAIFNKNYRPPKSPVLISGAVFLGIYTLAGVFGVSPEISFWSSMARMSGLILLYHIAALILVMSSTIKEGKSWKKIISASVFSAVLVAIVSYFGQGGLDILHISSGGGSTLGNSSYAGIYLVMNIFFVLYLMHSGESKRVKRFFLICATLIFLSPILINLRGLVGFFVNPAGILGSARASSVAMFLAFLVYVALMYKQRIIRYLAALTIILFLGAAFMLVIENSPIQRGLAEFDGENRFVFWNSAGKGIADRPALGWGPETFYFNSYQYFDTRLYSIELGKGSEVGPDKPHNAYLEIAVSGGFLSLLAYLAFIYLIFLVLVRSKDKYRVATLLPALFAYLAANLYFFDTVASYLMLAIIVAFSIFREEDFDYKILKTHLPSALIAGGLACVAIYSFVLKPVEQQQTLRRSFSLPNTIYYPELFKLSANGRQSMIIYMLEKSVADFSTHQLYIDNVKRISEAAEPYVEDNKSNYRLVLALVRASLLEGAISRDNEALAMAKKYEERLFSLSPNNPEPYWAKAQRQYIEEEKELAIETLNEAVQRWPDIDKSAELIQIIESSETPPLFF